MYGVGYFVVCGCMMKEELLASLAFSSDAERRARRDQLDRTAGRRAAPGRPSSQNGQSGRRVSLSAKCEMDVHPRSWILLATMRDFFAVMPLLCTCRVRLSSTLHAELTIQ